MTKTRVTLIKLISTRKTRQVLRLVWIVLWFLAIPLIGVGVSQWLVCKYEHPGRELMRCVMPLYKR